MYVFLCIPGSMFLAAASASPNCVLKLYLKLSDDEDEKLFGAFTKVDDFETHNFKIRKLSFQCCSFYNHNNNNIITKT